jgi:hypothetical protein
MSGTGTAPRTPRASLRRHRGQTRSPSACTAATSLLPSPRSAGTAGLSDCGDSVNRADRLSTYADTDEVAPTSDFPKRAFERRCRSAFRWGLPPGSAWIPGKQSRPPPRRRPPEVAAGSPPAPASRRRGIPVAPARPAPERALGVWGATICAAASSPEPAFARRVPASPRDRPIFGKKRIPSLDGRPNAPQCRLTPRSQRVRFTEKDRADW